MMNGNESSVPLLPQPLTPSACAEGGNEKSVDIHPPSGDVGTKRRGKKVRDPSSDPVTPTAGTSRREEKVSEPPPVATTTVLTRRRAKQLSDPSPPPVVPVKSTRGRSRTRGRGGYRRGRGRGGENGPYIVGSPETSVAARARIRLAFESEFKKVGTIPQRSKPAACSSTHGILSSSPQPSTSVACIKELEKRSCSPQPSTSAAGLHELQFPKVVNVPLSSSSDPAVPLVYVPWNKENMNKVKVKKADESEESSQSSASVSQKGKGKKNEDLYVYSDRVPEGHSRQVYGCSFNNCYFEGQALLLATAGGNHVTVYDCSEPRTLKMLQVYVDENSEHFYTTAWSVDEEGRPIVAAGGLGRIIRLMNTVTGDCSQYLVGHGKAINELKFHPREPMLLFSASEDHSIRLWNVYTLCCAVCFGGFKGHVDQVVTLDISLKADYLISGGMDHYVRFWDLRVPIVTEAIEKSRTYRDGKGPFPMARQSFAQRYTNNVHNNYIDCVRWFGGKHVVSRSSCSNEVVFWTPNFDTDVEIEGFQDEDDEEEDERIMFKLQVPFSHNWFIRFGTNIWQTFLGIGNSVGEVHIFDLQYSDPDDIPVFTMKHPKCNTLVRQVAISSDGSVIVYVCDDCSVWRWDKNTPDLPPIPARSAKSTITKRKFGARKRGKRNRNQKR